MDCPGRASGPRGGLTTGGGRAMKKNAAYTSPYEFTGLILLRQAIGLSLIGVGATPLPAAAGPRTSLIWTRPQINLETDC